MKVTADHWLEGVKRETLVGGSHMGTRRFLVIHHTAGWGGHTSIDGWRRSGNGICAHIVIDRDGTVTQCRPFDRTCGHAGPPGKSAWRDPNRGTLYNGLNSCSIGIELANAADLARETYPSTCGPAFSGKPIPRLSARHRDGGPVLQWEIYPDAQVVACAAVSKALVERYHLDDVIGHEDCSRFRKVDPGPAFNMTALRHHCGFTKPLATL